MRISPARRGKDKGLYLILNKEILCFFGLCENIDRMENIKKPPVYSPAKGLRRIFAVKKCFPLFFVLRRTPLHAFLSR